jgi:hypothetical protein
MYKRTQTGSGNPKRRKGGSVNNSELQLDNANTPRTNPSPVPKQQPPVDWSKARQVVSKWMFVFLSAWFYMELKKWWSKKEGENPMHDEREY